MSGKEPKDSFVRWQAITVTQLTYTVNLLIGLAVAAVGFQVTLLLSRKLHLVTSQKVFLVLSLLAWLASIGLGIWCVINRLRDFRATTKAAGLREDGDMAGRQPYVTLYKRLGERTWSIFWFQIGTFSGGVLLLGILGLLSL